QDVRDVVEAPAVVQLQKLLRVEDRLPGDKAERAGRRLGAAAHERANPERDPGAGETRDEQERHRRSEPSGAYAVVRSRGLRSRDELARSRVAVEGRL